MYINSPGGHVHDGLAIYDTMQLIKAPVSTICIGYACSMASLLLAAGEPGKRKALPHSFVMVHQPMSGTEVFKFINIGFYLIIILIKILLGTSKRY